MQTVSRSNFTTVTTEGAILPADLLQRIADGRALGGLRPEDYHLAPNERLSEAISRSWNRLLGVWQSFDEQRRSLPEYDRGTTLTRERWLLILLHELGYGRLPFRGSLAVDGDRARDADDESAHYPISHEYEQTPLHLISFRQPLDRADNERGERFRRSPHSLMQEFLNRSPRHLWGIVSNGLRLRLLRDNVSLTRAAYLEFDLEAMMEGEIYADFALLWLTLHQSRVESAPLDGAPSDSTPSAGPESCWLEKWSQEAAAQGARALDSLRDGVQEAISILGSGFLAHPANGRLRQQLQGGELSTQDYYRQLLRLVYRLIFLFVAEDRNLLLLPQADAETRARYYRYYSLTHLRELAARRRSGPHPDLYRGLRLVMTLLRAGYPPLGLPGLGSYLFSARSTPSLDEMEIANDALLNAVRALTFAVEGGVRRPVDYRNLGAEELGSVYESLLELQPELNASAAVFRLKAATGNERKTTGSYYTPTSLINSLLDTALEPVVVDRLEAARGEVGNDVSNPEDGSLDSRQHRGGVRAGDADYLVRADQADHAPERPTATGAMPDHGRDAALPDPRPTTQTLPPLSREETLLNIKVIDPACGSGHFLMAAANRLARHLARMRTGDAEPSPEANRLALRDVVRRCIYGVDINEMAVELCKVGLWLETLDPGKPLSFLDGNIQCGNSLIGATPALLEAGIPDAAFTPLTGDDKAYCAEWKRRNKQEREGQRALFTGSSPRPWQQLGNLAAALRQLDSDDDSTLAGVQAREAAYARLVQSSAYEYNQLWADAWCAAFVWQKQPEKARQGVVSGWAQPLTQEIFRRLGENPHSESGYWAEIRRLAQQYQFFHWHLAFPQVFTPRAANGGVTGWEGGFDVVLGNPPWERIKLQEKEWFASRNEAIATAPNAAARQRLLAQLPQTNPALHEAFTADKRKAEGESAFVRGSGRYPLCGRGDVNTYTLFAELARHVQSAAGRVGLITPSGIATDDTTKYYFQDIMDSGALVSLYDFENRKGIFAGVHRSYKFCLLTLRGTGVSAAPLPAEFVFFSLDAADLRDAERRFSLSAAEIALLNPNTRTCPIFRSRRDAELTKEIYRSVNPLVNEVTNENVWLLHYRQGLFHSSGDAKLFGNNTLENLQSKGGILCKNIYTFNNTTLLPFYEAKMIWHFHHRFGSYQGVSQENTSTQLPTPDSEKLNDPHFVVMPRYWIDSAQVSARMLLNDWQHNWFIGFRDITNSTNERTVIFSILPLAGLGDQFGLVFPKISLQYSSALLANANSYILDYVARQKIGSTHLKKYLLYQLPFLQPKNYDQPCSWFPTLPLYQFLLPRVLELTYTAWDLQPFAQDCGYRGPPFRWDEERRFWLRGELDAAYFHLYGMAREDVDYILDTFPIVRRKDEAAHGEYRTKRVILEIYDEMAAAAAGQPYQTRLDPPPAHAAAAHPWDEAYLGPYQPPEAWWTEEAGAVRLPDARRQSFVFQDVGQVIAAENDCLLTCALRFDGWKYADAQADFDPAAAIDRLADEEIWPEDEAAQLALFFMLQRALGKYGLEHATLDGKYWRAYRRLFLRLYDREIPRPYQYEEYMQKWTEVYQPQRQEWAQFVQRIHEQMAYVAGPGVSLEAYPTPQVYQRVLRPPEKPQGDRFEVVLAEPSPGWARRGPEPPPPKLKPAARAAPSPLAPDFTPPQGSRSQRLKQVMTLGDRAKANRQDAAVISQLAAALGDSDDSIRWLAGSTLRILSGSLVVATLAAFLQQEPAAPARQEVIKALKLIADVDEDRAVRAAAQRVVQNAAT